MSSRVQKRFLPGALSPEVLKSFCFFYLDFQGKFLFPVVSFIRKVLACKRFLEKFISSWKTFCENNPECLKYYLKTVSIFPKMFRSKDFGEKETLNGSYKGCAGSPQIRTRNHRTCCQTVEEKSGSELLACK